MATPTIVNDQITDAVTQTNVKVLADAPGSAMATVYQIMSHATGLGMQNAVANQQQFTTLSNAAVTQGVNELYTVPTATSADATQTIFQSTLPQLLADLQAVLASFSAPPKVAKKEIVLEPALIPKLPI